MATVAALHPAEVLLDERATAAQKRALLAELALESYGRLHVHGDQEPDRDELLVAHHLYEAAQAARTIAERERRRCAALPARAAVPRQQLEGSES